MKRGDFKPGDCVLRAKINMSSHNMHMRDPVMYRIINASHHRTGNQWKIYPTYDWTHGQSDFIESISHSFCTLEFEVHRELYDWFLNKIPNDDNSIIPKQREFARLNLSYTVMSKRKLADDIPASYHANHPVSKLNDPQELPDMVIASQDQAQAFAEVSVKAIHNLIFPIIGAALP
mgnify:CR=1 FL=1